LQTPQHAIEDLFGTVLQSSQHSYTADVLPRAALQVYARIREHDGTTVRTLRMHTGMQQTSSKRAFDRSLTELQRTADIVIFGISEKLNEHGNKSGWDSTCYMLTG
jgi:hypothetical protein